MEGKAGSTLLLHNVPGTLADRVLLVGLGKEKEFREKEYRAAIATAVKTLNETGGFDGTLFLTELPVKKRDVAWRIRQATMVALETLYRFDHLKSKKDDVRRPLRKLTFCVERRNELAAAEEALTQGAGHRRRHRADEGPGQSAGQHLHAEPIWPNRRRQLAKDHGLERAKCSNAPTWKSSACTRLLSVAKGSHQPPKFIVLKHTGGKAGREADRAGRQGHHLRHRRHLAQAGAPRWTR